MSNHLAIAQATAALCAFVARMLREDDVPFAVDVTPRKPFTDSPPNPTITVFLYQVAPNAALRNRDAPTRSADGALLTRPQAALDLSYLISFYGEEAQLQPQQMLGSVVRGLYEEPVLSRQDMEEAATLPHLAGGDLASAAQRVRFTPTKMDVDGLSKLWSMLFQIPYALSVAYEATAVLLDGRTPPAGKPVLRRTVRAIPARRPVVRSLLSRRAGTGDEPAEGPVPSDHEILLVGDGLRGDGVTVRVGEQEVAPSSVGDDRVVLTLPEAMPAGIYPLRVLHDVTVGQDTLRRVIDSNVTTVVRQPTIAAPVEVGSGDPVTVTVRLDPPVRDDQRVQLLLDEVVPEAEADRAPTGYQFAAPYPLPSRPDPATIEIAIAGVRAGDYLVRGQVDGVTSGTDENL
ncbi:DUF4255 domain-containing protein, partial [Actinomadura sp. HBU206391]|uniref:DUF4255 domain-containing protein n=1 Tax=Actinomadura sp. HBU206391 TaxID=2731692 RepID=UPI001650739D